MDIRRRELEELEHRIALAHRLAGAIREMRLATARTESEVATYAQGNRQRELDILERILQLRVKYKPAETLDAHVKELRQLKRHQQLADAKEQAVLDSIAKRVRHRAAYIQLVNEKFPDMADELIDFYDQQVFRRGTRM